MNSEKSTGTRKFGDYIFLIFAVVISIFMVFLRSVEDMDKRENKRAKSKEMSDFLPTTEFINMKKQLIEDKIKKMSGSVVSLAPNMTQIMIDLGEEFRLKAVASGLLHPVSVQLLPRFKYPTTTDDWNMFLKNATNYGNNLVVLGSPSEESLKQKLPEGPTYVPAGNLYSLTDVVHLIRHIELALKVEPALSTEVDRFIREATKRYAQKRHRPPVAVIYPGTIGKSCDAKTEIVVAGQATPEHDVIGVIGGRNIFVGKVGYPKVTIAQLEALASQKTTFIVPASDMQKLALCPQMGKTLRSASFVAANPNDFVSSQVVQLIENIAPSIHQE